MLWSSQFVRPHEFSQRSKDFLNDESAAKPWISTPLSRGAPQFYLRLDSGQLDLVTSAGVNELVYFQAYTRVEVIPRGVRRWDGDMCMNQTRIQYRPCGSNQMERDFSVDHLGLCNLRSWLSRMDGIIRDAWSFSLSQILVAAKNKAMGPRIEP